MSNDLYVAKTIIKQLQAYDPYALGAWAFKNPTGSDKKMDLVEWKKSQPAKKPYFKDFGVRGWLQFDVNGAKFKGRVYVGLNAMDLYDVVFMKTILHRNYTTTITFVNQYHDIYSDQLMDTIDKFVERD